MHYLPAPSDRIISATNSDFIYLQTSSRPDQIGGGFASRRGHTNKLSISDPSHHVTEAIGTLYDTEDEEEAQQRPVGSRPMSYIAAPNTEEAARTAAPASEARPHLDRSTSDSAGLLSPEPPVMGIKKIQTSPARIPTLQGGSFDSSPTSPISPTLSLKDVQDNSSTSQFPLGNIENPSDIRQELSNLQALRRMSMDVGNNNDPDMLPFSGLSLMPSIAPTGDDDEADPNRLLWVPARVHPELAPTEFQSFLESRVKSIKRRSGESLLSPDDGLRGDSGSLKRKKSMLSRQVDPSGGSGKDYVDGAERLGRQRSQAGRHESDLTLDELVKDPNRVVQRLAQESALQEEPGDTDMPILPIAPGAGLRRSTRTTYRKGASLRRSPYSKRTASRQSGAESSDDSQAAPPEAPKGDGLDRPQSEPVSENVSRPSGPLRKPQKLSRESNALSDPAATEPLMQNREATTKASHRSFHIDGSGSVPQIGDTPLSSIDDNGSPRVFPQRSSSQMASEQMLPNMETQEQHPPQQPSTEQPPPKSTKRQGVPDRLSHPSSQQQQPAQPKKSPQATTEAGLNSGHVPVDGRDNRTDALTYIPTQTSDDRKPEKRNKKDEDSSSTSSSKSGWKWFKGSADDKKKKDEDKKSKTKGFVERAQDNVRLDVIQSSIENAVSKGRESLLLDREGEGGDHHRPHEDRKKESHRKSNSKKEKDGNIFSSFFGGGRKKSDKESSSSKKGQSARPVSDEPAPYRPLRPDVDYSWTRFPLLEERAIYRMAHIKLANPRRSLHSQVLLSNFMYNYLAIVQAMHPQMQIPTSPQQRRQEEERRRKEQEEQYLAEQQMQQQEGGDGIDRYTFDYHRVSCRRLPTLFSPLTSWFRERLVY